MHRQAGAPMTNIQSPLGTAPDLCKNVSLQCYLVATVIHIQALRRQTCVYVHILFIIQRQQSVKTNKKNGTAVNEACQTFGSSNLGYIQWRTECEGGGGSNPPPRNSEDPATLCQTQSDSENC